MTRIRETREIRRERERERKREEERGEREREASSTQKLFMIKVEGRKIKNRFFFDLKRKN